MTGRPAPARRMWALLEPLHAVTYFAPEARSAFEDVGLRGFWRGYFAGRAAPLGAVDTAAVTALFAVFSPAMVGRAVPDVWARAAPEDVLSARVGGATAALRRVGGDVPADDVDRLVEAVGVLDGTGRALGAANLALLDTADDPLARLWQAATAVREHRGDGHVASLALAGVDGCAALVWRAAIDGERATYQDNRGWTDEEWAAAVDRLRQRGWLDGSGFPTAAGRLAHEEVEASTDRLASGPWSTLDPQVAERLVQALAPLSLAALASFPQPNPIGLPPLPTVTAWLRSA